MRKIVSLLLLLGSLSAAAQVRTYGDLETRTFVIGLANYYFGDAGSLTIPGAAKVTLSEGRVVSGSQTLLARVPAGDCLIGAHDFTDDGMPELLVATRAQGLVKAQVYRYAGSAWTLIGTAGARGDVDEIRVFRQALTVKDRTGGVLYTWTCHGGKFDFKSSDGGPDPAASL